MIYNWYQSQVLLIWVLQPRVKGPHFIANRNIYLHNMDFMSPPTFDILNIQNWKVKMSLYLKALGIHVYFATIKESYCLNGKNLETNAKAIHALKSTLNDEYLSRVANFDSAFVVWNALISLGEQKQCYMGLSLIHI